MNNNDYNELLKNAQTLHTETRKRLSTAREIAINLYRKHFHNYMSWSEYRKEFPWIDSSAVSISDQGPQAGGQKIPRVYLSNDVWRIASSIRRQAYAAALRMSEETLKTAKREMDDAKRLSKHHEQKLKYAEDRAAQAARVTVRLRSRR